MTLLGMGLFGAPLPVVVPLADQIECVERELKYRRRVYARRVADEKMTQALADREIARMQAVLATLQSLAGGDTAPSAGTGEDGAGVSVLPYSPRETD